MKTKEYTTAYDNQESVEIQIYQGERLQVIDNIKLAEFILSGIEPSVAGQPKIEVTFRVDQDGILHVSGKDLHTGNFKEITITDSVRLSEEQIADMIRDADNHAVENAAKRQQLEMEEQPEQLVKQLQNLVLEHREVLSSELMGRIAEVVAVTSPEDWEKYIVMLKNVYQEASNSLKNDSN